MNPCPGICIDGRSWLNEISSTTSSSSSIKANVSGGTKSNKMEAFAKGRSASSIAELL